MAGTVVVASMGIAALVLIFLYIKLGDETISTKYRWPLQIVILSFILGMMILLSKTSIDYKDNCAWLVNNTVDIDNVTTNYNWSYNCSTNSSTASSSFYDITLWLIRIIAFVLVVAFGIEFVAYMGWYDRGGKEKE